MQILSVILNKLYNILSHLAQILLMKRVILSIMNFPNFLLEARDFGLFKENIFIREGIFKIDFELLVILMNSINNIRNNYILF